MQVVDGIVYVAQALALDVQRVGTPYAGADEDRLVPIAEEVLQPQGLAHVGVGADFDVLQAQVAVLEVVQHTFGQTELRDAVAQHTADLIVAFKNGHIVAKLCQIGKAFLQRSLVCRHGICNRNIRCGNLIT